MERKKNKTTIRNKSEANVSKVHLPEVRPENSSYKIAGKKKLAAASFEHKKEAIGKAAAKIDGGTEADKQSSIRSDNTADGTAKKLPMHKAKMKK